MNNLLKNRKFQLWNYRVSHGMLLIRSPKHVDCEYNVDLEFIGVEYIAVPRHLKEVTLTTVIHSEIETLEQLLGKAIAQENIFVLSSPKGRHIIVATSMKVEKNKLDIFDVGLEVFSN